MFKYTPIYIIFIFVLGILFFSSEVQAARLALVIGNAAYKDSPLKNPVNDARAISKKLTVLGFKVQMVENMKRLQIGKTVTGFVNMIRPGDDIVVFYAGHGVQLKGVNYFPAVDAEILTEEDVALNSLNLNTLLERLDETKGGVKLLFLDACRNNPFARNFRGGERGLARVPSSPTGTLIGLTQKASKFPHCENFELVPSCKSEPRSWTSKLLPQVT